MSPTWLGARLDGDAVFLDPAQARLIHVDPEAFAVWEQCDGHTAAALAHILGLSLRRVNRALKMLAQAGAVAADGERWRQSPLRWV